MSQIKNQLTKKKQRTKTTKAIIFRAKTSERGKIVYFVFCKKKNFSQKKLNWFKIILITSNTILLSKSKSSLFYYSTLIRR